MIVEGYMDVVRLHQAGITYAVATLGTATTQEHLNKLFKMTSEWSSASTATARVAERRGGDGKRLGPGA